MLQMMRTIVRPGRPYPIGRMLRDLRNLRNFPRLINGVRGKFASFEEAAASAPRAARVGYDSPAHATMYDERIGKLFISDYAVLLWLSQLLPGVRTVFDLGGHKGELFYGFRSRLTLADDLRWIVCDVPTTVEEGRRFAQESGASSLEFTSDNTAADGCDLMLASGVLQYLEDDLATLLKKWKALPKVILVNNTPMYDGDDYVTLQNTALSYNPYRVFNQQKLVKSLEDCGYVIRDHWRTERTLSVPLHPELFVESYQGFVALRDGQ